MAIHVSIIVSLTLLAYVCSNQVIPSRDIKCPIECHCYYLGVNWQTDCSASNMTTIPLDGLDPHVYTLIMDTNHLEKIDPLPANIKVRSLQLSHNSLTTIPKETFAGLHYLLDVGLSSNLINYIHPEAFIENVGFITLQLQNNPLKPVNGPFLYSKTLRFLHLENCQLTALSHRFFAEITGLVKVDLSGNPLRQVEAGVFDPLTTLKHLILNNCNIMQVVMVEQYLLVLPEDHLKSYFYWNFMVGKFHSLEHLELKQSGVSNLPENLFFNYTFLRRLVLAENLLTDSNLDTTLGQNLANIDYLDLSYCNLKAPLSKYAFAKATKLHTLILSGNNLSASGLGVAFSPLSKLVKLSLSNCGLTELQADTFHNLTNLKELDISMNPLNKYFSEALSIINRLTSLEHLNMSYTNTDVINGLTSPRMTSLKSLILSGNKIKSFVSGFLNNFPRLVLLELNNCGLSKLDSTVFNGISENPVLEELRVSGNPLQLEDKHYFKTFLPKLKSLDMSYCNLTWYSIFQRYAPSLNRLLLNNNRIDRRIDLFYFYFMGVYEDLSNNNFTGVQFKYTWNVQNMPDSSNITSLNLIGNPWICECAIIELWKWAKPGLVGSHLSIASNIETNSLVCNFDPKITRTEGLFLSQPCPAVTSGVQYTWARYVREFKDVCFCLLHYKPRSSCHYGWTVEYE